MTTSHLTTGTTRGGEDVLCVAWVGPLRLQQVHGGGLHGHHLLGHAGEEPYRHGGGGHLDLARGHGPGRHRVLLLPQVWPQQTTSLLLLLIYSASVAGRRNTKYCTQDPHITHLEFKAIQDFSRLFENQNQDCFNDICTFKHSKLSFFLFWLLFITTIFV